MPQQKPARNPADWVCQLALALDLPFLLVGSVLGGCLIGYLLDSWLHTEPWLMLVLGALGFAAGLRAVLRSLSTRSAGPGRGNPSDGAKV